METQNNLLECLEWLKPLYQRATGNYYFDCGNGVVSIGDNFVSVDDFVKHVIPDLVRNGFTVSHIGASEGDPLTGTYVARRG